MNPADIRACYRLLVALLVAGNVAVGAALAKRHLGSGSPGARGGSPSPTGTPARMTPCRLWEDDDGRDRDPRLSALWSPTQRGDHTDVDGARRFRNDQFALPAAAVPALCTETARSVQCLQGGQQEVIDFARLARAIAEIERGPASNPLNVTGRCRTHIERIIGRPLTAADLTRGAWLVETYTSHYAPNGSVVQRARIWRYGFEGSRRGDPEDYGRRVANLYRDFGREPQKERAQ